MPIRDSRDSFMLNRTENKKIYLIIAFSNVSRGTFFLIFHSINVIIDNNTKLAYI